MNLAPMTTQYQGGDKVFVVAATYPDTPVEPGKGWAKEPRGVTCASGALLQRTATYPHTGSWSRGGY